MPSLLTHWSLNPFKSSKTCLIRPKKPSCSYITTTPPQVNEWIHSVNCTELCAGFGKCRSWAWRSFVQVAHGIAAVTVDWNELHQPCRHSRAGEHTRDVGVCQSSCATPLAWTVPPVERGWDTQVPGWGSVFNPAHVGSAMLIAASNECSKCTL